jgi:hypothetical protein
MIELLRHEIEQLRHHLAHPERLVAQLRDKLQNPDARIWVSLIGGTFVWALYLMIVYPLTSLACQWGWFAAPTEGSGLKMIQTLATLLAAGLVAGSGYVVFSEWQRTRTESNAEAGETTAARIPMLAFVTLLLNSLYLLIILVSLLPILMLAVCGR